MARTHFVRFLTTAQVNELIEMLNAVAPDGTTFPKAVRGQDFSISAPDGDVVLAGLWAHSRFITRLHREVFNERTDA